MTLRDGSEAEKLERRTGAGLSARHRSEELDRTTKIIHDTFTRRRATCSPCSTSVVFVATTTTRPR